MAGNQAVKRMVPFLTLLVVLASQSIFAAKAGAGKEQYLRPSIITWRPTHGSLTTETGVVWPHRVIASFYWNNWVALADVDAPRTPSKWGTYEHEINFFRPKINPAAKGRWCDPSEGVTRTMYDLPLDFYRDTVDDEPDEFTWGFQTWRLVEDRIYGIDFECKATPGVPQNNEYLVQGQIGHCHIGTLGIERCTSGNTFADNTTRFIPRPRGRAPEIESFYTTFTNNISFEGPGLSPWQTTGGSLERSCPASPAYPNPLHAKCMAILRPSSPSSSPIMHYTQTPNPIAAATESLYNSLAVRCHPSRNTGDCTARVQIVGKASDGTVTRTFTRVGLVPRGERPWWLAWVLGEGGLPSNTVSWTFSLQPGAGQSLDVDYNSQYWYVP